jgi:uncharacterized protein (DUF362 family)
MNDSNRRWFLRWMALQMGAVAGGKLLSACGRVDTTLLPGVPNPTQLPSQPTKAQSQPTTAEDTSPAESPTEEAPTPISLPDMAVARGGEPESLVSAAIAALGGMERFVKSGDFVVVKPNICVAYHTYEYAATTNPWVVGGLVKQCLDAGASRVLVMDYPFGGSVDQAYVKTGIQDQVLAAGGEMESFAFLKFLKTDLPEGVDLKSCHIYEDILSADVIINVPIAKQHGLARLTLGMKNLMGVIRDRPEIHTNLGQRLADLTGRIRPALTVVDAVRILTYGGPSGGDLNAVQKLDTVIASPDIVAVDSYAATLFNLTPADLTYIRAGTTMGLGRSDLENLKVEEIALGT